MTLQRHPNGPKCGNIRNFWNECRYCGELVFWHLCDCGVKVPFDHPSEPWPVHQCKEYLESDDYNRRRKLVKPPVMLPKGRKTLPYYNLHQINIPGYVKRIRGSQNALACLRNDYSQHTVREVHKNLSTPFVRVALWLRNQNRRYIFFVEEAVLEMNAVEEGDTITATLVGIGRETWICKALKKQAQSGNRIRRS